jgi:hypothetical protein
MRNIANREWELETITARTCGYHVRLPSPIMIEELVQAWKELRRRGTFRV